MPEGGASGRYPRRNGGWPQRGIGKPRADAHQDDRHMVITYVDLDLLEQRAVMNGVWYSHGTGTRSEPDRPRRPDHVGLRHAAV